MDKKKVLWIIASFAVLVGLIVIPFIFVNMMRTELNKDVVITVFGLDLIQLFIVWSVSQIILTLVLKSPRGLFGVSIYRSYLTNPSVEQHPIIAGFLYVWMYVDLAVILPYMVLIVGMNETNIIWKFILLIIAFII